MKKLKLSVERGQVQHVNFQAVLVSEKLFHSVVELQEWADQDEPVFGVFDQLFEEVICRAGVQELCHEELSG